MAHHLDISQHGATPQPEVSPPSGGRHSSASASAASPFGPQNGAHTSARSGSNSTGGPKITGETPDLQVTLERLAHNVATLLNVSTVSLSLLDGATGRLAPWVMLGTDGVAARPARFGPAEDVETWVASHLAPISLPDMGNPGVGRQFPSLQREGALTGSLLCLPLIDAQHILGALTVMSPLIDAFDDGHMQLL